MNTPAWPTHLPTHVPGAPMPIPGVPMQVPGPYSTGFVPSHPDSGMLHKVYSDRNGARDYLLHIPEGYHGQAVPLVVMLHGGTQTAQDFAIGTQMNDLAETEIFLVAYPAQSTAANRGRFWNWFQPGDQVRGRGEPAIIAGITRQIMTEYTVDAAAVHVAGLSAGGAMAATLAVTYPDVFACAGIHSGLAHGSAHDVGSAFAAMKTGGTRGPGATNRGSSAVIVIHGDQDTVVAPVNADRIVADAVAAHGATAGQTVTVRGAGSGQHGTRTSLSTDYFDQHGRLVVQDWRISGAPHAWAGGSAAGSYTDPQGPDATALMVRFFGIRSPGNAAADQPGSTGQVRKVIL
jgi:poly(hydroxyalkanoate) depolymerase family esterase